MVGKVDFNKDMDFWQIDRRSGFFPVKWHILKDIPNYALVHITLENNEYKSVTCSRDTQEVGLKEGLEMLNIFKNYSAKSCLLDDFNFYEKQEKPAQTEKTDKSAPLPMDKRKERDFSLMKPGERRAEENPMWTRRITDGTAALINQTKNLSLNDRNLKNNSLKKW
ncbi:YTH domain-containing family protein 2 isoform X2 [Carica papaya]|uniref:YTH domain-containing family protein 2 isoform X2 n=1 Tax=Carica papaya TaxID=3649 RepID=UPI000B8D1775|nr:YTH domain-containing family protein 2 isoform X2 [Carica papaya]